MSTLKAGRVPGELLAFRTRQKPEEADSALRERMQQQHRQTCHCYESKQANQAFPFHLLLFLGCHQKVPPILRVGLLTSINPVKQIPHGIADSRVKLTAKTNHYNGLLQNNFGNRLIIKGKEIKALLQKSQEVHA